MSSKIIKIDQLSFGFVDASNKVITCFAVTVPNFIVYR